MAGKMGNNKKNVHIGIGTSFKKDPYEAAVESANRSLKDCEKPTFSIVYTNSEYDQKGFLDGVNSVLGKNWAGISTDKIFTDISGYDPNITIAVLSISSDYIHFSVDVVNHYRRNPRMAGYRSVKRAIQKMHADKYVDAYIQFLRTKRKDYGNIIRNPPYFILTYIRGLTLHKGKTISGKEIEFVSGILEYTGPHIPLFGGSASASLEEYLKGRSINYQFANGKIYKDAAIVVFVICNLHFTNLVEHGYELTKDFATITNIDKTGYDILEINSKEPISEYARLIGISKKQYLKDSYAYSVSRPFSVVLEDGTTMIKEAVPNPDNKTLHSNFKLYKNAILNIMKIDKRETAETLKTSIEKMFKDKKNKTPAIAMFCSCSGRRPLIKNEENKNVYNLRNKYPQLKFFGFYSYGEVGSTRTMSGQSHSQTVTSLIIYNQLLTE